MAFLSLNSVNSNLVEVVALTTKDRFKGKGKKFQKSNHNLKNQNAISKKI